MENQQPEGKQQLELSEAQLEAATNQMFGWEGSSEEQPEPEATEEAVEGQAQEAQEPAPTEATESKEPAKQDGGQSFDSLKPFLDDTPFKGEDVVKGVESLVKSYKSLQSEFTPLSQKMKAYKDIIDRMEADPEYKQNMLLADQLITNPKMREAYQAQQMGRPDPRQYDLYTPEGLDAYNKAEEDYLSRQLDSRINQRFMSLEQERIKERQISELRQAFPDTNPDEVMRFAQEKARALGLSDFAKLQMWDSREAQLTERIRKEMTTKLQQAQEQKTPPASPAKETLKANDVAKHLAKWGYESAAKKFGEENVLAVLEHNTNAHFA